MASLDTIVDFALGMGVMAHATNQRTHEADVTAAARRSNVSADILNAKQLTGAIEPTVGESLAQRLTMTGSEAPTLAALKAASLWPTIQAVPSAK